MPYIITTRTPYMWQGNGPNRNAGASRTAVATLEEARETVLAIAERPNATDWVRRYVPESGAWPSTIGPLPDGTVIEVQEVPAR